VKDNVATVKNVKNISQLPLTGAAGVFLFLIVAALLAGGAGTMVMISKRNKKAGMAL
jgi:LPXTG-motif cell wall-anchored protein